MALPLRSRTAVCPLRPGNDFTVPLQFSPTVGAVRLLSAQLYGISATDPLTFSAVTLILLAIALLSCYIPARRAIRLDPAVALRYD